MNEQNLILFFFRRRWHCIIMNTKLTINNPLFLLECLFCEEEEEKWDDEHEQEQKQEQEEEENQELKLDQDCFSFLSQDDEELDSLFIKEQEIDSSDLFEKNEILSLSRVEAAEWILKVNAYYGFSSLTALLAINYLDRFISTPHFQREKPWMVQLLAVTCISLAAKVEEIQVPFLLDLQVEDAKFVFEAKTIQRMELLVLSTLQWKMHPLTPFSFLDLFITRLGFKNRIQIEFFRRCERVLLSLASDSRSVSYLPSVLAISTMATVIEQMGNYNSIEILDHFLKSLNINKERVNGCCNLIMELSISNMKTENKNNGKRKKEEIPESPNGIIDASFSSDNSNDSWAMKTKLSEEEEEEDYYFSPPSKRNRALNLNQPPMILLPSTLHSFSL